MAEFPETNASTRRLTAGRRNAAPYPSRRVVLVTGGGGFLGRHIVAKLLARGDAVRVLGRRPYPDLTERGVDCRQGDVSDPEATGRAVDGVDAVIHTAAIPGVWGDFQVYYRANYLGTKNIIDAAIACGVRKMVYTSTPSVVHGGHGIVGGDESLTYPRRYLTHYAATKAMAERLALAMNSHGFAVAALRPHLMFGPGDTQLIPKLLDRARAGRLRRVGSGRNMVSVSYVENVAEAHLNALDRLEPGSAVAGQAYFINQTEPVNCWDFINRLVTGVGLPAVRRGVPFHVAYAAGWVMEKAYTLLRLKSEPLMTRFLATQLATDHWFVIDKARRDLGWEPSVSTDEGVERVLAGLRREGGRG